MSEKSFSRIFTHRNSTARLSEQQGKPLYEEDVRTYGVEKKKNKYIVYELPRKRKPKRIKTITSEEKEETIIRKIQQGKIRLSVKNTDRYKTRGKTIKVHQVNYLPRRINKSLQLVCLVRVMDTKRNIVDSFLGFSNKRTRSQLKDLRQAKEECKNMAIAKFISIYGMAFNSGDIITSIVTSRFQYYER